jgi:hypothetical protein
MERKIFEHKLKRRLKNLYHSDTDWSVFADWFIEWIVENDFQLESFSDFVDYIYESDTYTYTDYLYGDVWDFFFGWGNITDFITSWVNDKEVFSFTQWLKEKGYVDEEEIIEIEDELKQYL